MIRLRFPAVFLLLAGLAACNGGGGVTPQSVDAPASASSVSQHARLTPLAAAQRQKAELWAREHPLRPGRAFRDASSAQHLWLGDFRGAIWETKAGSTINSTGDSIVGAIYDCAEPDGLLVDHAGNLWAACAGSGTVQMYAPNATTATRTLKETRTVGSTQITALPESVAVDASGNVYVSNAEVETVDQKKSIYNTNFAEVDIFRASSKCGGKPCNGATPDIKVPNPHANGCASCSAEGFGPSFADVAPNGDVYQDFNYEELICSVNGCAIAASNVGVDVIKNILGKKPTFTPLVRGMIEATGVYLSAKGRTLNVVDSGTGIITQYAVPSGSVIGRLGPTPEDLHFHDCAPDGLGFNQKETLVALGDAACHDAIVGNVAQNHLVAHVNSTFGDLSGAAFAPSDK